MIKIAYVVSTLKRSGPINQLFSLLKYIDRGKYAPSILTLSNETADSRWKDFEHLGIQIHSLNMGRMQGILLGRHRFDRLIARMEPAIIHSTGIRADCLSFVLERKLQKISTFHCYPQHDYLLRYGRIAGKYMVYKHGKVLPGLKKIICVSEAVNRNLRELYNLNNTTTICNGVDREIFNPVNESEKSQLRSQLNIPKEKKVFISTGHLSEIKNPLEIITAFNGFNNRHPDTLLIMLGNGPLEDECRAAASSNENIRIEGRVKNVFRYLHVCDYFISASIAEGLPYAVIEALSCGLPVILSDIDPHREIFSKNRQVGTVYQTGSVNALMDAMESMLTGDNQLMGKNAIGLIADEFSAEIMTEQYQKVYDSLYTN